MKRGQAAIEYLTTYGWMILLITISTGALTYFGVFSPSAYVPERCYFSQQLVCEDYLLEDTGADTEVQVKLRNNFKRSIQITDGEAYNPLTGDPVGSAPTCSPFILAVGETADCDITLLNTDLSVGDKYAVPLELTFRRNGSPSGPPHNMTGEVYAEVQ
jgi:hypothetical protein